MVPGERNSNRKNHKLHMFNYFWQKKYDTIKVKPIANITKNASYIYKYKNQQNLLVTMSRP